MKITKIIKTIKGRTIGMISNAKENAKEKTEDYVNCLQVFENIPSNIKKVKFTFFPIELNEPLTISIQKSNNEVSLKYSLTYLASRESNSNAPIHYTVTIKNKEQIIFTADNENEISNYLTKFFTDKDCSFNITKDSLEYPYFFKLLSLIRFIL